MWYHGTPNEELKRSLVHLHQRTSACASRCHGPVGFFRSCLRYILWDSRAFWSWWNVARICAVTISCIEINGEKDCLKLTLTGRPFSFPTDNNLSVYCLPRCWIFPSSFCQSPFGQLMGTPMRWGWWGNQTSYLQSSSFDLSSFSHWMLLQCVVFSCGMSLPCPNCHTLNLWDWIR